MFETRDLTSGYSGTAVVRRVSLNVQRGEIVALLGPNGAGKTTTLSSIFGTLRPLGGDVIYNGQSVTKAPPHSPERRGIGYVPEGRALAPSLSVYENLRLVNDWAVDPFETFPELQAIRTRKVGLLSGGEQQMLAVARGLTRGSQLLLVDELSFGLAPILVDRLLTRLRSLATDRGLAVLVVEQYVRDVLEVADRVYVLVHGDVVLEAPATELRNHPEQLTHAYLGETTAPLPTEGQVSAPYEPAE